MFVHVYLHACVFTCMRAESPCLCMYIYIRVYLHTCMPSLHACVCMFTCIHTDLHVCVCLCFHMFAYMHA